MENAMVDGRKKAYSIHPILDEIIEAVHIDRLKDLPAIFMLNLLKRIEGAVL